MSINQELMVRLFRTMEGTNDDGLIKVGRKIIDHERSKGHTILAKKLESILNNNIKENQTREIKSLFSSNQILSSDKRNQTPLAQFVKSSDLRHDMILSVSTENSLKRIEKEYAARERLALHGLRPRKKILFYGPPGCGKSMSAERIAWNTGLPFLKVRFEAIMSSYLGESASNLKRLFDSIQSEPHVLLLDEFDFIAKARSSGHDVGEIHRLVNVLLNLLEDYNAPGILIATTNLEGSLDKAVFRRFDDVIEISRPGTKEISRLLKQALSGVEVSKDFDLSSFSKKMVGFSAAQVVKVANDAAKESVIKGNNKVESEYLLSSLKEAILKSTANT